MRRALIGLAITTLSVLAFAAPASAAAAHVKQLRFNGTFAEATWSTSSATTPTYAMVTVSESPKGSELFVDQIISNLDANGNFTGGTETIADVISGFSFAIDRSQLTNARLIGSSVPATTCTYDADVNLIGCTDTTIDVNAAWTGQGTVLRGVVNQHTSDGVVRENIRFNGTSRFAPATGTVGGVTFTASDLIYAEMGTTNAGTVLICIGSNCG